MQYTGRSCFQMCLSVQRGRSPGDRPHGTRSCPPAIPRPRRAEIWGFPGPGSSSAKLVQLGKRPTPPPPPTHPDVLAFGRLSCANRCLLSLNFVNIAINHLMILKPKKNITTGCTCWLQAQATVSSYLNSHLELCNTWITLNSIYCIEIYFLFLFNFWRTSVLFVTSLITLF